jgi:predicted RNA binding protein YcfA (HicA-like mRNA interferase family)
MRPMRVQEVRRLLNDNGAVLIRQGKHEIYRARDGQTFALSCNHGNEVAPGILRQLKRIGIEVAR